MPSMDGIGNLSKEASTRTSPSPQVNPEMGTSPQTRGEVGEGTISAAAAVGVGAAAGIAAAGAEVAIIAAGVAAGSAGAVENAGAAAAVAVTGVTASAALLETVDETAGETGRRNPKQLEAPKGIKTRGNLTPPKLASKSNCAKMMKRAMRPTQTLGAAGAPPYLT